MATSNDEIMRALGRLEGAISEISKRFGDFARDTSATNASASASRARIHERLEEQSHRITEAEKTAVAAGAIAAQQRDVIASLETSMNEDMAGLRKMIDRDIKPTIEEVKEIKQLGKRASIVLIALGFTAGGAVMWASDTVVAFLRKWLRID